MRGRKKEEEREQRERERERERERTEKERQTDRQINRQSVMKYKYFFGYLLCTESQFFF